MAQERWAPIEGFPLYEVSDRGRVRNVKTGHIKIPQINQAGIVNVLLVARGEQSRRSVAVMVAEAFLPEPPQTWNATPINMDGDRTNNWVDNLEWRPRWFAIRYHQQFHRGVARGFRGGVQHIESGEIFDDVRDAAMKHGMLVEDVIVSAHSSAPVFPSWQRFQLLPQ
jgi:hypothetical protein